jgi:hypothetical protein
LLESFDALTSVHLPSLEAESRFATKAHHLNLPKTNRFGRYLDANVGRSASFLSEVELALGNIDSAVIEARKSLRSVDPEVHGTEQLMTQGAKLGNALHQAGQEITSRNVLTSFIPAFRKDKFSELAEQQQLEAKLLNRGAERHCDSTSNMN